MVRKAIKKKVDKKKKKVILPYEEIGKELNIKQESFCQYYARNDFLYGNATKAYAEAYGFRLEYLSSEDITVEILNKKTGLIEIKKVDNSPYQKAYDVCNAAGARLLANVSINKRIKEIHEEMMIEAEFDSELVHTMRQREDYGAKMQAIKEFNRMKGRVTERVEVNTISIDLKEKEKIDHAINLLIKNG